MHFLGQTWAIGDDRNVKTILTAGRAAMSGVSPTKGGQWSRVTAAGARAVLGERREEQPANELLKQARVQDRRERQWIILK